MSIFDPHLFRPSAGFMGAPQHWDLRDVSAAVVGLPFDCGTHPRRIGARQGPAAIREQSLLLDRHYPPFSTVDPISALRLVDCGDAVVAPGRIADSFEAIENALHRIAEAGVASITMGGDGAVTLPQLRAWHRVHPDLAVVHVDAHTDAYPPPNPGVHTTATTFTYAAEERLVEPARSFHIGIRGSTSIPDVIEQAESLGYRVITADTLYQRGVSDVLQEVRGAVGDRPVYLCWDMDAFDPSCAPGVCDPAWGGLSARDGLGLLEALSGLNIVAIDVNTVSPPHDVGGMTAHLAATVMLVGLHLLTARL